MYRIDNATAAVALPTPQIIGPNPNGYFKRGNPSTATPATIVDDDFLNSIQEELCYLIEQAGITLDKTSYTQLYDAFQVLSQGIPKAASTTAANTYTATMSPAPSSYVDGYIFSIEFTNGNTGAATLNLNSLGAKDIKRMDGTALVSGDIYDGMTGVFIYDGTNLICLNINQQRLPYASSSSSASTYSAGLTPPIKSYVEGMTIAVKFINRNVGASTINLNSAGAKTIKRNDGTDLRDGDIVDGMVAVLTYDGTNFQLHNQAGLNPQPNSIIGGDFSTNPWQRGTTYTSAANNTKTADMWTWIQSGSGVVDIKKTLDAPNVSLAGVLTQYCYHTDVTTADASIGAGDYYANDVRIEGYDFAQLAQKTMVLSFLVKSPKTGTHCVALVNSGGDRSYVAEFTVNAADNWEYKSVVITASPDAGSWNYTNGIGLRIIFPLAAGSTYQTSAGAWQTGLFYATSNQVNCMDSNSNNYKINLLKIEPGNVATPWFSECFNDTLEKCQRYYNKTFPEGVTPAQSSGSDSGAITYYLTFSGNFGSCEYWTFPVHMRASPTITFYSPFASGTKWYNITGARESSTSNFENASVRGVNCKNNQTGTDEATNIVVIHATAEASL